MKYGMFPMLTTLGHIHVSTHRFNLEIMYGLSRRQLSTQQVYIRRFILSQGSFLRFVLKSSLGMIDKSEIMVNLNLLKYISDVELRL